MRNLLVAGVTAAVLCGCTAPARAPLPSAPSAGSAGLSGSPVGSVARYRCEQNIEFTVLFEEDSVTVDAGPRGSEVLLRDAGGATPQQTVYSNARMRAEFGLGVSGREAILRYPHLPLVAHCVRE